MHKPVPFDAAELTPKGFLPGFHGSAPREIWNAPSTFKENWTSLLVEHRCHYLASALDFKIINPRSVPDLRAKSLVNDCRGKYVYENTELDSFGVEWIFQPGIGAIERPGGHPLQNISEWRAKLKWPNIESWKWEEASRENREYCADAQMMYKTVCVTGLFERLISFLGFENALIAMIDDGSIPHIHDLFGELTQYYCDYISHMKSHFNIGLFEFHDDWGSQQNTLFSPDVYRELIFPYVKSIVAHCHKLGVLYEQHSCGKIERLLPNIIDTGADLWMGQSCNNKLDLFNRYGDKIIIGVELPVLPTNATDKECHDAIEAWAKQYLVPNKPCALSIESAKNVNRSRFEKDLYILSRKAYFQPSEKTI